MRLAFGVPVGLLDWASATPSTAARRRTTLKTLITAAFDVSRGTYGARRLAAVLHDPDQPVSVRLVGQLMAELGLVACQPRPWRRTTLPSPPASRPDLLGRDFTATEPGTRLVGDITYVRIRADLGRLGLSGHRHRLCHSESDRLVDGEHSARA